jgi:uncharacterized coiled-coil DUF342 family protein
MVEANREVRELLDKYQSLRAERKELVKVIERLVRTSPDSIACGMAQQLLQASPQRKEK